MLGLGTQRLIGVSYEKKDKSDMNGVRVLLVLVIMLAPGVVLGASFDCSKASTVAEKTICASQTLSGLDEELEKVYESSLKRSDNPDMVRNQQQRWLRTVRDRCRDEVCLKNAYENRLSELSVTEHEKWKSFRNTRLGIEFSYPRARKVRIGCRGSRNCVALVGKPMPRSDYLIAFEVFDGDLETVAREKAVFEKENDRWIARGRFGDHPVEALAGPGWQGLKATVTCGISDSAGFHGGAGECLWVVLSNGKRSVVGDTQGIAGNDQVSMDTIRTFRFLR